MTSLAKQLQRLAVPQTQVVFGEDKKKASLLFDPKEAAGIDRETFHALGLNGLEELETLDKHFQEFESSLFGDSSLTFERTVQTKQVNDKLNIAIQRFLIRLSPYCLLKPAHKALEWLIHRFHIHFSNTDELLLCFLPYHESKIFIRVLQLIKFDSKLASKWDWLEPLQKNGVHLSKKTLLNHCSTDPAFFSFVCDMIPTYVKVLSETDQTPKCRVLFSFYATTIIGILETKISEVTLSTLLPHLSHGLKCDMLEYKAASYMILAQLLYKTNLKTSVLKTLQNVLAKSLVPELVMEAMACMLLMFQNQDMSSIKITSKAFKYLCKHFSVVDAISQLYAQFDTGCFLSYLLDRLIPAAFKHAVGVATSGESSQSESSWGLPEYMPMLHRLLSTVKLPESIAEDAAYKFLSVYIRHGNKYLDDDVDDRIKDSLQGIVRQLEGRHSAAVDKAVNRTLAERTNQSERDLVQEFLNLYVLSVPHQLITDSETSLILSLNHRLPAVREKAVDTLIKSRDELEDATFLKDSLLLRLNDEEPKVVSATLSVGQDLWTVVEDDVVTITHLQKVLLRGISTEAWEEAGRKAAQLLGGYTGDLHLDVFMSCLPCFFIMRSRSKFNIDVINILMKSSLFKLTDALKAISKEWKSKSRNIKEGNVGLQNAILANCVATGMFHILQTEDGISMLKTWTHTACENTDKRVACLLLVALDDLVAMATDLKVRLEVCYIQLQLVYSLQKCLCKDVKALDEVKEDWLHVINAGLKKMNTTHVVPQGMCFKALYKMIHVIKVPETLSSELGSWQLTGTYGEADIFLKLCVLLYDMLLEQASVGDKLPIQVYRTLLLTFNQNCFSDIELRFKLLGLLWTQHANDLGHDLGLSLTLQARSLHLGLALIKTLESDDMALILASPSIFSNLLVVLTSPCAPIREAGLRYAKELLSMAKQHMTVFLPVIKKIVRCEGEVLSDPTFIQQVILSVFKSTSVTTYVSPMKARRRRSTSRSEGNEEAKDDKPMSLLMLLSWITRESTPCYLQCKLLDIFFKLNNNDVLETLIPLLDRLIHREIPSIMEEKCLTLLLQRFTLNTSQCLAPGSQGLEIYQKSLETSRQGKEDVSCNSQLCAISQMTKDLYGMIEDESQSHILSALFDVGVDTKQLEVTNQLRRTLKHLLVNGVHVEAELKKCLKLSTAKTVREAKRQKRPEPTPENVGHTEFDSRGWQRVTVVLEAVQNKKKVANYSSLVPVCFQILSCILESDIHTSAEYIKQLILSLLYNVCSRLEKQDDDIQEVVPEKQFNMDLIVNCIRSSDNPQTHHHALLLLTAAAKIYPEHLLNNMMSVFTFMGANIMRQDDAYSFLIIGKILETVVPALITACKQRKRVPKGITNDLEDIITTVIQVFVDSYPYIPEHRRHLLFNKLLTVIGEKQYLWRLMLLMMKLVVTKGTLKAQLASETQEFQPGSNLPSTDTEFCLLLSGNVPSAIQLSSTREMLEYILKLPDDKEDDTPKPTKQQPESFGRLQKDDAAIFNVVVHSGKQLRHFKYATVNLLVSLFSNTDFILQVSESGEDDLRSEFQSLLETVLKFVSHVTHFANKSSCKPTAKFWKALQHKTHDMLDKLVSLLPDSMFIAVIGGLMSHNLPTIQRKAMELLNSKLQLQRQMEDQEAASMLPLVEKLCKHVTALSSARDITEDSSVNCQTAFICLKLLCRNIGLQHRESFVQVLKTSVKVFKSGSTPMQVSSCALLCIAEICNTLKVHVIQHLPSFMPSLVATLADGEKILQNELYLMSVVTTVNKVVENLSHFLSPYLQDILASICILLSKAEKFDVLQKPPVQLRLKTIRTTLSTSLPTRVLLPVVTECYTHLVSSKIGMVSLMSLFGDHIAHITREDLTSHMAQLQNFFLKCLDMRTDFPDLTKKKLLELEGVAIDTVIAMVLKLSESSFKVFLFKVFDWATSSDDNRDRVLVFYHLAERLAERLRSLFTLFAGHIISHAANMLDKNNSFKTDEKYFPSDKSKHRKSCELLVYILDCVAKCCLHDTQGFINKERFDLLMQPLVDQLENYYGGEEVFSLRVSEHVAPCIVQLCVAAQDDTLWRALNYQICLKTRCPSALIKEASLITLDSLHKRLGEDYMPLLPDTIPFLAELMEDESEEVEKKCHEVIRDMEKTLGEPLQKYF